MILTQDNWKAWADSVHAEHVAYWQRLRAMQERDHAAWLADRGYRAPSHEAIAVKQKSLGVDRAGHGAIRGYVIAEEGPFKSEGRGEFDGAGIVDIVRLINSSEKGVPSRLGHPNELDDGVTKFLGRVRDAYLDTLPDGRVVARGTLYFCESAHKTPHGNLAKYVMDRVAADSDSISTSLMLRPHLQHRKGLPPLWKPLHIWASDVVDTGDAVGSILSPTK